MDADSPGPGAGSLTRLERDVLHTQAGEFAAQQHADGTGADDHDPHGSPVTGSLGPAGREDAKRRRRGHCPPPWDLPLELGDGV